MRVLVVQGHGETRRMLERVLAEAGHTADPSRSVASGRIKAGSGAYGAIILDRLLPDGSGADLCRELRKAHVMTPVLILTDHDLVDDRVRALDAGADDCMRKPFAVAELLARLRALLRRGPGLHDDAVTMGDVEVRLSERRVLRDGRDVSLTAREFAILEVLMRRHGHVVSRRDLLASVWGQDTDGAGASLEVLIGRLRRKLTPAANQALIQTQRGFGYRLRACVAEPDAMAS